MLKKIFRKQKPQEAGKLDQTSFLDLSDKENNSANLSNIQEKPSGYHREMNAGPVNSRILFQRANQRQDEGYYDEAIILYERAVDLESTFHEAYNNWGNVLSQQGKYKEACEKYKKAIEVNPKDSQAYYNWGNALSDQDKYNEAIEKYMAAVTIRPDYIDAYTNWALLLLNQGEHDKVILVYSQLEEITAPNHEIYLNWGNALRSQGKDDDAIAKYALADKLSPDNSDIFFNWGLAWMNKKKYEDAVILFAQVINIDPEYREAYNQWGLALQNQMRYNEAIVKYRQFIDVKPCDYEAYNNWGYCLYCLGKYEEAVVLYQKAIELNSNHIFAHINLGLALFPRKEHSEALKVYIQGISAYMINSPANKDKVIKVYGEKLEQSQTECAINAHYSCQERIERLKQVIDMLTDNSDIIKIPKPKQREPIKNKANELQKDNITFSDFRLVEYYTFLYKEFSALFSKAFTVGGDSLIKDEHRITSLVSLVTRHLPPLHTLPSLSKVFPTICKMAPTGISARDQIEVRQSNRNYQRFIAHFTSYNEIKQVSMILAHKLTILRRDILLANYEKEIDKESNKKAKVFKAAFGRIDIDNKSEEYAFLDIEILILICFLEGVSVQKYSDKEEKVNNVAEAIFIKMEQYSQLINKQ